MCWCCVLKAIQRECRKIKEKKEIKYCSLYNQNMASLSDFTLSSFLFPSVCFTWRRMNRFVVFDVEAHWSKFIYLFMCKTITDWKFIWVAFEQNFKFWEIFNVVGFFMRTLTRLHRAMNMRSTFIVHPIKSSLDGQSREHSILCSIAIRCRNVYRPTLVVQRIDWMKIILIPALRHSQLHTRPLIHHRDCEDVQFLFQPL